jgi:hypothetical protein
MIIGIAGAAGSGKDTVAGFISEYSKTVSVAQADPMKRFAAQVFGFSEFQLWGPSEARNGVDERYLTSPAWGNALVMLGMYGPAWVREVLPDLGSDAQEDAFAALKTWFATLARVHGFEVDLTRPFPDMKPTLESLFPATAPRQLTCRYVLQTIGTEWGRQFSSDMWNKVALRTARKLLAGGQGYSRREGLYAMTSPSAEPEFVVITDVRFKNEVIGIGETGGIVINIQSPSESNAAIEAAGVKGHRSEAELKGIPSHWFDAIIVNDKSRGLLALENCVHTFVNSLKVTPQTFSTAFTDGSEYETYQVIGNTQSS